MGELTYRFGNGEFANRSEPSAPFAGPILIDDFGNGYFPHAFMPGTATALPICRGLAKGWAPAPEVGGVLLAIFAGNPDEPTDEAVATLLSRDGLRALIADLQSIDQQLGKD
ncbi:hypothetical protein [Sphingobium sp. S8]|uniref:hypothetical protein n=2 Tax=unclassified Sphingobium TaxID=2611147 RepID=UPI001F41D2B6|nr:hypothetical protein [Sphingobium sp. S8]